jgi:hypothetical protein
LSWLPQKGSFLRFFGDYSDRFNIKIRQQMHALHGGDPDSLTPDGVEEADAFYHEIIDPTPF